MSNVPYSSKVHTTPQSREAGSLGETLLESGELRGFYYDPRSAIVGPNYLLLRWLPREGPLFVAFIQRLRLHCYANPKTGELRNQCFPSLTTLAHECGVSRRTICRLLARDAQGRFVNRSLERFLKIIRRRRYDARLEREVQTSNLYLVALDDPPAPEDDERVAEKAAELAALLALSQTPAVDGGRAGNAPMSGADAQCQTDPQSAVPVWHSRSRASLAQEGITPKENTSNHDIARTKDERRFASEQKQPAEGDALSPTQKTLGSGSGARTAAVVPPPRAARPVVGRSPRAPAQPPPQAPRYAHDQAFAAAIQQAGGVLATLLREEFGASNPAGGALTILDAFVAAQAPLEVLTALASLGRQRLRQQLALGNPIENQAGYYIALMRELAWEARLKGWDVAQLAQEDEAKSAQAQRRVASARQQGSEPEAPAAAGEAPVIEAVADEEATEAEPGRAPAPLCPDLPAGVERLEEPALAVLADHLPDPETGQPRSLSMLWGFVRQALWEQLTLARRQHLGHLIPKWDQGRPRTLLLLSRTTWTARFVAQVLRPELERQVDQQLSAYFDDLQVVYAPAPAEA